METSESSSHLTMGHPSLRGSTNSRSAATKTSHSLAKVIVMIALVLQPVICNESPGKYGLNINMLYPINKTILSRSVKNVFAACKISCHVTHTLYRKSLLFHISSCAKNLLL